MRSAAVWLGALACSGVCAREKNEKARHVGGGATWLGCSFNNVNSLLPRLTSLSFTVFRRENRRVFTAGFIPASQSAEEIITSVHSSGEALWPQRSLDFRQHLIPNECIELYISCPTISSECQVQLKFHKERLYELSLHDSNCIHRAWSGNEVQSLGFFCEFIKVHFRLAGQKCRWSQRKVCPYFTPANTFSDSL